MQRNDSTYIYKKISRKNEIANILGVNINVTNYQDCANQAIELVLQQKRGLIFAANVHMIMEAYDSQRFQEIVNCANIVTPDGMPLVWTLRLYGHKQQRRVYGPDLMLKIAESASRHEIPIGLYGGDPLYLSRLQQNLLSRNSRLNIAYSYSPPFRILSDDENKTITRNIINSGVKILFVGLGCPKQEQWAFEFSQNHSIVIIAVGAAFDFHSGRIKQAPSLLQNIGCEWLFRLISEPRRLFTRYLKHNPRFIMLIIYQFFIKHN